MLNSIKLTWSIALKSLLNKSKYLFICNTNAAEVNTVSQQMVEKCCLTVFIEKSDQTTTTMFLPSPEASYQISDDQLKVQLVAKRFKAEKTEQNRI